LNTIIHLLKGNYHVKIIMFQHIYPLDKI
jgi:hypothetical protein